MCRPGVCIKGHPKTTGVINPLDWLPEELNWSRRRKGLPALVKCMTLFKTMTIFYSLGHHSMSLRCLQVFDEQRWLTGRGYDGRIVRVESNSALWEGEGMSLT